MVIVHKNAPLTYHCLDVYAVQKRYWKLRPHQCGPNLRGLWVLPWQPELDEACPKAWPSDEALHLICLLAPWNCKATQRDTVMNIKAATKSKLNPLLEAYEAMFPWKHLILFIEKRPIYASSKGTLKTLIQLLLHAATKQANHLVKFWILQIPDLEFTVVND